MKYTLTWKDIILEFIYKFILLGFPIFFTVSCMVSVCIFLFSGTLWDMSLKIYLSSLLEALPTMSFIYFLLLLFIAGTSYPYWKNTTIGEHEIILEEDYFVWKGYRQEVKTKLNLLQSFKITPKYIILKFAGIQKAKISRKWITQGEKEFIKEMNIIKEEMIRNI